MAEELLDPLFEPPPQGSGQPISYRQGTIVAFNPVTLSNTVRVGRSILVDLPLLGVAEADTLAPGSVVGLQRTENEYAIVGRFVRPNTAEATDAVNRLSNSIKSTQIAASEDRALTSFGDLTTVGPIVAITVKSSGKLLVLISADITCSDTGVVGGGLMTVEVKDSSGSVVFAAGTLPNFHFMFSDNATHLVGDAIGATRAFLINPGSGDYVITAKYQAEDAAAPASFANRNVTAIAL